VSYPVHYAPATAPRLGAVFAAIDVFSRAGKEAEERSFTALFEELKREGAIHPASVLKPRIFGPHEAMAVADEFARAGVDVILIYHSAFPNGHVFPSIALHRNLAQIPVIIAAGPEPDVGDREWTTNAWCGVIMANFVAKQVGRFIRPLGGDPASTGFRDELRRLLNSYRAISMLRRDYLGRFGDAPGGFHSATMDQFAYLRLFGTRVETIDLLGLMSTYQSGKARGYVGEFSFTEDDVSRTAEEMTRGRPCLIDAAQLRKGARLYHAFEATIAAFGFTSIAVKCWPEILGPGIDIAPCLPMTWLLAKRKVTAAACESDCPTAVMQSLGTLLSGRPAACLDFVNHIGGNRPCVELGHCGAGIIGEMGEDEAIGYKSPDRQNNDLNGPALIGQFQYGKKTGLAVAPDGHGGIKMLCFTGENTPASNRHKLYSAADLLMAGGEELQAKILAEGFPHHAAVAAGDISAEVREVCATLGIVCHFVGT
jgi:L-fucose isomerase-like protein